MNQRALINKILARYSGEFTVFRELLQNSDDAGCNSVEIRFETQAASEAYSDGARPEEVIEKEASLPDLKTLNVRTKRHYVTVLLNIR